MRRRAPTGFYAPPIQPLDRRCLSSPEGPREKCRVRPIIWQMVNLMGSGKTVSTVTSSSPPVRRVLKGRHQCCPPGGCGYPILGFLNRQTT